MDVTVFDYIVGTFIGLFPGIMAYCYMGIQMKEAATGGVNIGMVVSVVGTIISIFLVSSKAW